MGLTANQDICHVYSKGKTATDGPNKQTTRQTDEHRDSKTESAQWADSVKLFIPLQPTNSDICPKTTQFFQIALMPKRAGLMCTFFLLNVDLT